MITWKFDIGWQKIRYKEVKNKLKTEFYQNHKFYVLPFMPEKFRNRIVFLPEVCEPQRIYQKQRIKLQKMETEWKEKELEFTEKLKIYFPKVDSLDIVISPSFYGPIGSYELGKSNIVLFPRYDRAINDIQKLLINTLVHYFFYNSKNLDKNKKIWLEKQKKSILFQNLILPNSKSKPMTEILDGEFAGNLAKENANYLKQIGFYKKQRIIKPQNLTKKESLIFDLLIQNKDEIVTYDQIADTIWTDSQNEKYSQYAITKLMERLKKKLPKNSIHPQRGLGYILY